MVQPKWEVGMEVSLRRDLNIPQGTIHVGTIGQIIHVGDNQVRLAIDIPELGGKVHISELKEFIKPEVKGEPIDLEPWELIRLGNAEGIADALVDTLNRLRVAMLPGNPDLTTVNDMYIEMMRIRDRLSHQHNMATKGK